MDAQQSSIIKATRYVFQQTWQPTIDNWQPTTDNLQQVKEWQGSPDGPKESFDRQVLGKYFFY